MIIQYASDLHLERSANFRHVMQGGIAPAGDVLVLAGDVANLFDLERCGCFWDWCSEHFKQTIFVPGNHDYYGTWSSAADGVLLQKHPQQRLLLQQPCCQHRADELYLFNSLVAGV